MNKRIALYNRDPTDDQMVEVTLEELDTQERCAETTSGFTSAEQRADQANH